MNNKGYLLSELIISLLIIAILINVVLSVFKIFGAYQFLNHKVQDEIMIYQLRRIMLVSDNIIY